MRVTEFFKITELRTKIVSVSTLSIAVTYTMSGGIGWDWGALIIMTVATLAIDMGTTAFNSFYDYWHGVDRSQWNREDDKILLDGRLLPSTAFWTAIVLFMVGGTSGIVLAIMKGWWLLPAGAACMLIGFLYNGGPLPISRTPFGEAFAGTGLGGALFVITALVLGSPFNQQTLLHALPSTFAIAAILAVNNACDIHGDRLAGRFTFAIAVGPKLAVAYAGILMALAFASGALMGMVRDGTIGYVQLGIWVGVFLVAGLQFGLMVRGGFSHARKGASMQGILRIFLLFTLAMIVSIIVPQ